MNIIKRIWKSFTSDITEGEKSYPKSYYKNKTNEEQKEEDLEQEDVDKNEPIKTLVMFDIDTNSVKGSNNLLNKFYNPTKPLYGELEHEPDNLFDENALKINLVDRQGNRHLVGYVPNLEASIIGEYFKAGYPYKFLLLLDKESNKINVEARAWFWEEFPEGLENTEGIIDNSKLTKSPVEQELETVVKESDNSKLVLKTAFDVAGVFVDENNKTARQLMKVKSVYRKINLVEEPTNPYDKNAVQVLIIDDNEEEQFVGYVPRNRNEEIIEYKNKYPFDTKVEIYWIDGELNVEVSLNFWERRLYYKQENE